MLTHLNFSKAIHILMPLLIKGLGVVFEATILGFLLAVILSLFIAIGRLSQKKILCGFLTCFLEIIRGTPLLVQLLYIYYVIPLLLVLFLQRIGFHDAKVVISSMIAGVLGLGINYGCYLSEVIRASILAIDIGQTEAAIALGLSENQTLFRIVIPQAMRNSIPVFGNYLVMMIKDTSLLSYVTVNELLLRTQAFASQTFLTIESYTLLAVAYMALSLPLSKIVKIIEMKIKNNMQISNNSSYDTDLPKDKLDPQAFQTRF